MFLKICSGIDSGVRNYNRSSFPDTLDEVVNGDIFPIGSIKFQSPTHFFSQQAQRGNLIIKRLTPEMINSFKKIFVRNKVGDGMRPAYPGELQMPFKRSMNASNSLYSIYQEETLSAHVLHVLDCHFKRLQKLSPESIPKYRLVALRDSEGSLIPAVVQEIISGQTLTDYIKESGDAKIPSWIVNQLRPFMFSMDADIFFGNFIVNTSEQKLIYIDIKPSAFLPRIQRALTVAATLMDEPDMGTVLLKEWIEKVDECLNSKPNGIVDRINKKNFLGLALWVFGGLEEMIYKLPSNTGSSYLKAILESNASIIKRIKTELKPKGIRGIEYTQEMVQLNVGGWLHR